MYPFKGLAKLFIPENEIRIYRPDEFEKPLMVTDCQIWRARILLARTAGLRRSEALNLTAADVDFERGLIHVQPKVDTDHTWAWMPKGREQLQPIVTSNLETNRGRRTILELLCPSIPLFSICPV